MADLKFEIHASCPSNGLDTASIVAKLTQQDIDDIMVSALEGGICYWSDRVEVKGPFLGEYASDQISRGGSLRIHICDPADDEPAWHKLTLMKFLEGFGLWIENGGDRYGAVSGDGKVNCGQIDGPCADEIVQYALFGKLVFG